MRASFLRSNHGGEQGRGEGENDHDATSPPDLRIPRIPSDQRILVEPHIDPSRTQRLANKGSVSFTLSITGILCSNNEPIGTGEFHDEAFNELRDHVGGVTR